jgi:hypothetical protein
MFGFVPFSVGAFDDFQSGSLIVSVTGVQGTGAVGNVTTVVKANATGVEGLGEINGVFTNANEVIVPDTEPLVGTGTVGTVALFVSYGVSGTEGTGAIGTTTPEVTHIDGGAEGVGRENRSSYGR